MDVLAYVETEPPLLEDILVRVKTTGFHIQRVMNHMFTPTMLRDGVSGILPADNRFPALLLLLATLMMAGCASRPINQPITEYDPQSGYRPYLLLPKRLNNDPTTLFVLSFSGGGTRAAAFSYGVLEELRRTPIVVDGQRRRLIDEVDIITGVSGGSFTALAYALHGDQLFDEYEQRFLKRDV